MKKNIANLPLAFLLILAAGCQSTKPGDTEQTLLPDSAQQQALSKSTAPQYYGFSVFPVRDGVAFSGAARLHPRHLAVTEFLKGEVPAIKVQGRSARHKMNMLLDTSSPDSWLEFGKAHDFGVSFLGSQDAHFPYRGGYNTGGVNAYAGVISQLRIKQLFMENIPFYVRMASGYLGPQARGVISPKLHGVIGYDIMRQFESVQIDLQNHTVEFSATIPYVEHEDLVMTAATIVNVDKFGLAVEGAIFGEPTPIILDVAGDFYFVRSDAKVSVTKQVSLGDLVFRKVPTMLYPVDTLHNTPPPRVGRQLLKNYLITICPKRGVVYFERYPTEE